MGLNMSRQKLTEGMIGLAVGDAVGVPAEFKDRDTMKSRPVTDMVGDCGVWLKPVGTWSDDTAMALATLDAINNWNGASIDELEQMVMKNFIDWFRESKFACDDDRFDIGNTVRRALTNYEKTGDTKTCGVGGDSLGNGALMRILPTAITEDMRVVEAISKLTHSSPVCTCASKLYIMFLFKIATSRTKEEAYNKFNNFININKTNIPIQFRRLISSGFINLPEKYINSTGYVVDTLEAAIWCFMNTNNYRDCILKAVNLGGDTDTIAAVAGGLAGVCYGINPVSGIPFDWIAKLRDRDKFVKICGAFGV